MLIRTIALAVGLMSGVAASQLPEFAQQYRQRLGGAIDELRNVMQLFDADAAGSGLDRVQALYRLKENADPFMQRRGISMSETADRLQNLEGQRSNMDRAGSFGRIYALFKTSDADLLHHTAEDFEPAVPVTSEGFVTAAGGLFLGWAAILALGLPFRSRRARMARH